MAFFKKKETAPKANPREEVEKTIEQTEAFVRRADKKRTELLAKAKLAKARGDKMSYSMAVNALRTVMQQQKRAEQMVLSMGIMLDLRDVNELTSSFMTSMKFMCNEMGQLPQLKEMSKVAAEFNKSMTKMNEHSRRMDEYMMVMSETMSESDYESVELTDEIGQMIERELATELDDMDIAVAKELENAKNKV